MAGRQGVGTLMKYFGKKPGQTIQGFAEEAKKLPDEDFNELLEGIKDGTETY